MLERQWQLIICLFKNVFLIRIMEGCYVTYYIYIYQSGTWPSLVEIFINDLVDYLENLSDPVILHDESLNCLM